MSDLSKAKSQLKLDDLYFTQISYRKVGASKSGANPKMELEQSIAELEARSYRVTLFLAIEKKDAFQIEIEMVGEFSVSEDLDIKPSIIRNNTAAIMFPYIRSEVTLLTAQPNMPPIVIPPINIAQLLKDNT